MRIWTAILLVAIGGGAGSVLRYLLSVLAQRFAFSLPHGTLWANLIGCFVIGVVTTLGATGGMLSPAMRLLLATGICGGFTTMSSFIYELMKFLQERDYYMAAGYFGLTLGGCVVMFVLGCGLTRLIIGK